MDELNEARIQFETAEAIEKKCRTVRDSYKNNSKQYLAAMEVQVAVAEEATRFYYKWLELTRRETEAYLERK